MDVVLMQQNKRSVQWLKWMGCLTVAVVALGLMSGNGGLVWGLVLLLLSNIFLAGLGMVGARPYSVGRAGFSRHLSAVYLMVDNSK